MLAQIKHLAIASDNYPSLGRFYEVFFGLKESRNRRPHAAVVLSDGYLGLNINPRSEGKSGKIDHFGFEVSDLGTVMSRVSEKYPSVEFLERPTTRPFAGISTHDPAGNFFDLSHRSMSNRTDAYTDNSVQGEEHKRRVHHFMLRAMDPASLARYYTEIYELQEQPKDAGDPRYYLSDGRIILVIAPWRISDWEGSTAELPSIDHIGFAVESIDELDADIKRIVGRNRVIAPRLLNGGGDEREARLKLFQKCCPFGRYHLADPDGNLIDVLEA
jgi:predicted enzyme related to lactoylglutathione lyase